VQTIKNFGFNTKEELLQAFPGFPLMSQSAIDQARSASMKGNESFMKNSLSRTKSSTDKYDGSPAFCVHCVKGLSYSQRNNKFCSKACSVSHNNVGRKGKKYVVSEKGRDSLRRTLAKNRPLMIKNYCKVSFTNCKICDKFMVNSKRKTCSRECQIIASTGMRTYQNGRKRLYKYYNKWTNNIVTLESSYEYETALFLDEKDINWIRPKPIKWFDAMNKSRMYYPDFYLPDFNLYLDPKNPYVMKLDENKMNIVSKQIAVVYGGLDKIKNTISNLNETYISELLKC